MDIKSIRTIVEAALQAPTGDNSQPLYYHWDGSVLKVYDDTSRSRCVPNVNNYAVYVACGAALVNMELKARELGFQLQEKLFSSSETPNHLLSISFSRVSQEADPLTASIGKRFRNLPGSVAPIFSSTT